jgi:PAS domain S-box-containing protein
MQRGGYRDVQTTIRTKEGCLKDLLVSTSIVRHQGRDWLLSAYRDITERVQAEEALQESEVRYRTLVEQIPAITYTAALDEAGTTLYISPQVQTYLGYSQQDYEIDPDAWRKALYPEDYARVMEQVAQSQAEGGPFVSEYRMIARDGRVVWFRDEGVVVRDDAGCPLFLQGVMFDITERKEAEEALRKAKEELENKNTRLEALYRVGQIINSTLESNAILDRLTDEAMRVTRATHGQVLVVREEQGHFERRSLRGFSPQETELARTVLLPLDQGMNGRVYMTLQTACLDDVRTDPSYFPLIPATCAELAVPIIRAGRILGNLDLQSPELGAFRDVDLDYLSALADQVAIALENARIFRAVEQSRRDWETTFDAMQDAVALVDRERRIVRVNQAFADIVHSPPSQVVGQMHHAVLGGENCPEADCCPLEQTMESGQPARCIHEYGGRVFEVQTTPVWERNGGEPGYTAHMVYVMRDITERVQAEEVLRRTERLAAMGRLAAALTHEINNPLQAIRSNLELVLSFDLEPDEREGYLYVCHQEIERLAEISQCVLSFARPARDARRPTSLAHLIQRTLALVGKQLQHANVQVAIDLPIDMPPILVAPDQIVQVLLNFMINAAEIMPDGGLISVKADQDRDAMVLMLANDGPHIPPEHIEHIFDPFFTTKPDGTGLGLSISHSIIQGHGGAIHVENLTGERGVRFTITLPIAPPVGTYEAVA